MKTVSKSFRFNDTLFQSVEKIVNFENHFWKIETNITGFVNAAVLDSAWEKALSLVITVYREGTITKTLDNGSWGTYVPTQKDKDVVMSIAIPLLRLCPGYVFDMVKEYEDNATPEYYFDKERAFNDDEYAKEVVLQLAKWKEEAEIRQALEE